MLQLQRMSRLHWLPLLMRVATGTVEPVLADIAASQQGNQQHD